LDLWLFLTVICHQPETALEHISPRKAFQAQKRFFEIVDTLFATFKDAGKGSKSDKIVKKLAKIGPPSTWSKSKK